MVSWKMYSRFLLFHAIPREYHDSRNNLRKLTDAEHDVFALSSCGAGNDTEHEEHSRAQIGNRFCNVLLMAG